MSRPRLKDVLHHEFRFNPDYEIAGFERMTPDELVRLQELQEDPDCFGILRPRENSTLGIKSVCKESALLFYSLQTPGRLPAYLQRVLQGKANQEIAELVLDGVLQVSANGHFVFGAEAHDLIYERADADIQNLGRIARLSVEAVNYGQRLAIDDPQTLSAQMYFYNRVPLTPELMRKLGDTESFLRFLGLNDGGACYEPLKTHWKRRDESSESFGWMTWSRKGLGKRGKKLSSDFKLYVSPALQALPEVLPVVVAVFTEAGVQQFKVGEDICGMARPDKIVAYFDSFEHVEDVGNTLAKRLEGAAVQGVPFTADLHGDGLLSWGMDPHEKPVLQWDESQSWRLWITNRLARALLAARNSPKSEIEPWRFALERLRLDGIDTDTWTPMEGYQQKIARHTRFPA